MFGRYPCYGRCPCLGDTGYLGKAIGFLDGAREGVCDGGGSSGKL